MSLDAMKQALELLESAHVATDLVWKRYDCITALRAAIEQMQEPVAWRDHVEQRLLTWRQRFVNKSGDQLALDDFMDKRSLDDLIDFVCDEYTAPRQWQGLTEGEIRQVCWESGADGATGDREDAVKAAISRLKEKNRD